MIHIAPGIKRSLPQFTGYSFIKFHWNPSITFSAIRLEFRIHVRSQDPDSDPDTAQNVTKSCRPPRLSTHKISSKSVYNLLRYPAKIQKSGVNLVPGSGLWSGSGSKVNPFVHVPTSVDAQNFIQIHPRVFSNLAKRQTGRQTRANAFTSSFVGGNKIKTRKIYTTIIDKTAQVRGVWFYLSKIMNYITFSDKTKNKANCVWSWDMTLAKTNWYMAFYRIGSDYDMVIL